LDLPLLIGHRGAAAHAPENTLEGIETARRLGLAWVEFDVMLSRDGVPMLLHDESLMRTTGDSRRLPEVTAAEAERLDAGSWFSTAFAGAPIPRFEAAIALLSRLEMSANVEIKPAEGQERETATAAIATLRANWPTGKPLPLVSSFSLVSLEQARADWPTLPLGYLVKDLPEDWQGTAERLAAVSIHPNHKQLTEAQAAAIKTAGYRLACYTVNDPERAKILRAWGVDCLITDDPTALG